MSLEIPKWGYEQQVLSLLTRAICQGMPLDQLERKLQPEGSSDVGFLGRGERLISRILEDWQIVNACGTTHEEIAERLQPFCVTSFFGIEQATGWKYDPENDDWEEKYLKVINSLPQLNKDFEFTRSQVRTMGFQECPWECENAEGSTVGFLIPKEHSIQDSQEMSISDMGDIDFYEENLKFLEDEFGIQPPLGMYLSVQRLRKNVDQRNSVLLTGLSPHLIREHKFFEGTKTLYRMNPLLLINALNLNRTGYTA